MLIHLSELFNCEGRKKVYTVETALDSVDFDGETFQIEKAEPFELELTAKTRHKYTMSGHATLTVGGHCAALSGASIFRLRTGFWTRV